jgi:hypothetical protein
VSLFIEISRLIYIGIYSWPLTLGKEERKRVLENKLLKGVFGPMAEELTGERRMHDDGLHKFCSLANIINKSKKDELSGNCSTNKDN